MPSYLRYTDEVEHKIPNEDETVAETLRLFQEQRERAFEKHRHGLRDAHAKSHGFLKGEIQIYDGLPEELAQGVFVKPKVYPVIVRFSTAPGELTRDSIPSFRGMALKLVGVPGEKTIPEDKDALTQDFLLVNHPTIPTGTVDQYLRGIKMLDVVGKEPEPVQKAMAKGTQVINAVASALGNEVIGPAGQGKKETGILDQTFTSMAALRYGDYVAKISAAPLSPELTTEDQKHPTIHGDAGLRDVVRDFFQKGGAEYEIRVQLCTDLERMPVEDGSIRWDEDESPYRGVAKLVIPAQDAYSDARRIYGDDTLTFNPWHCIPKHRPLGNIQRIRRAGYDQSTRFRHEKNQAPLKEPTSIDELPD